MCIIEQVKENIILSKIALCKNFLFSRYKCFQIYIANSALKIHHLKESECIQPLSLPTVPVSCSDTSSLRAQVGVERFPTEPDIILLGSVGLVPVQDILEILVSTLSILRQPYRHVVAEVVDLKLSGLSNSSSPDLRED